MKPTISIVIACFNEEEKIERCLKSYTHQTKKPYEIIVVDGGSTDNTVNIIKKFQKKNKRIKLLFEKGDRSPANARNIGWKAAKGNYVLFMDADSLVPKNFIELISDHITGYTKRKLEVYSSIVSSWKEIFHKYFWYGRTIPKYLMKNILDYKIWIRFLLSLCLIILPFFFFIHPVIYLWFLTFLTIFSIGFKLGLVCHKKSGTKSFLISVPLYVLLITLITGFGAIIAPFLYLTGRYKTGR